MDLEKTKDLCVGGLTLNPRVYTQDSMCLGQHSCAIAVPNTPERGSEASLCKDYTETSDLHMKYEARAAREIKKCE